MRQILFSNTQHTAHSTQQTETHNTQYTPTHNTQHTPTHNTQHTTHNTQHTTHNTQHTTHSAQQTETHNTQHTTHNTQHTAHNTQHTTHNTQHTTHTTHNTQHTTHNTQHTTHNTQHTTHNTQHTTSKHNTQHERLFRHFPTIRKPQKTRHFVELHLHKLEKLIPQISKLELQTHVWYPWGFHPTFFSYNCFYGKVLFSKSLTYPNGSSFRCRKYYSHKILLKFSFFKFSCFRFQTCHRGCKIWNNVKTLLIS
jgi:hypothetical protein